MDGAEMYEWFEQEVKQAIPENLAFETEPTVTPGVSLARVTLTKSDEKPQVLVRSDLRPEGVRMNFPLEWQQELSDWLGVPPADQYRLKSNWVHQPSIRVGGNDFDPYFKNLTQQVIKMLKQRVTQPLQGE